MTVQARVRVDARELQRAARDLEGVERQAAQLQNRAGLERRGRAVRGAARPSGDPLAQGRVGQFAAGAALSGEGLKLQDVAGGLAGLLAADVVAEIVEESLSSGRRLDRVIRDKLTEIVPPIIRETIPNLIFELDRRRLEQFEQRVALRRDRRNLAARLQDDPGVRREAARVAGRFAKERAAADFREFTENPRGPRGSY